MGRFAAEARRDVGSDLRLGERSGLASADEVLSVEGASETAAPFTGGEEVAKELSEVGGNCFGGKEGRRHQ